MNSERLTEIVTEGMKKPSPFGVSCKFIKLDDMWGIKVYRNKEIRDNAVMRQTKMYGLGYAPAIGASFDIGDDKFCYITEVAIPIVDYTPENADKFVIMCRMAEEEYPGIREEVSKLVKNMRKNDYDYFDDHYGNFGWLNGKLVCIDFGF